MSQNWLYLTVDDTCEIHQLLIRRFGGLDGIRDTDLLDSALAQPRQTFGGQELYATAAEKAARYAFGLAKNHPFADGNKRIAAACMGTFLRANGVRFKPRHDDFYRTIIGVADGSISFEALADWVNLQIGPQESH